MNQHTANVISTLEALFTSQVKMAEAHGLDTLPHISTARARMILNDLRIAKAELKQPPKKDPAYFKHLDKMVLGTH